MSFLPHLFHGRDGLATEDSRRDLLVTLIALLATAVLFGVAASSLMAGEIKTAVIDTLAGCFLVILVVVYRFTAYKVHCRYVGVCMMYALYLYLFVTQAAGGLTYMWHYTFPFFAIFLIGARHGAAATLLLLAPVFIMVLQDALSLESGLYTLQFATRYIPSVTVALVFAYLFERERERFRRQTRQAYEEQERIIAERTEQLEKQTAEREKIAEKLRQSQKMEAIGTMASGVAHDLNNILSGIVTYPELIRLDLPQKSPLHVPLVAIEEAGKRAATVVSDLLTIARNAASVKEITDLNFLIAETLNSPEWKNFSSKNGSVSIVRELCEEPAAVSCSPVHVKKSLMNLLINAVEATAPSGKVTLSTALSSSTENVVISVRDEGPGVPLEHMGNIFEPFYTTKKMGRSGSGLGLAVVWNTIEEHDGKVTVENLENGARFTITLPMADPTLIFAEHHESNSYAEYKGQGTILVIDDEPQPREIAARIASKLGYTVSAVESGEQAVEYVKNQSAQLVLLDMVLGEGMNGLETYRKLVAIHPGQKAVIVSGYSTSDDVQETLSLGADSVVKKPYTVAELGKAIKDVINS